MLPACPCPNNRVSCPCQDPNSATTITTTTTTAQPQTAVPQLDCLSHFSHHTRIYLSIIAELETSLNIKHHKKILPFEDLNIISQFSSSSSDWLGLFNSKMTFSNLFRVWLVSRGSCQSPARLLIGHRETFWTLWLAQNQTPLMHRSSVVIAAHDLKCAPQKS